MMASSDGHHLPNGLEQRLYQSTIGEQTAQDNLLQWTLPTSGPVNHGTSLSSVDKATGTKSSLDLRQAIMQLQYFCKGDLTDGSAFESSSLATRSRQSGHLRTAIDDAELRSFCDAVLIRPFERASEVSPGIIAAGEDADTLH